MKSITNEMILNEVARLKKLYKLVNISEASIRQIIENFEKTYSNEEQEILKGQIKIDENYLKLINKDETDSIERTIASLIFYKTKLHK